MTINWYEVFQKYEQLDNGSKALIKRANSVDEIKLSTILFQLGVEFNIQSCRAVFCWPFLSPVKEGGNSIGKAIAVLDDGDIGKKDKYTTIGKRLLRVVRLETMEDLYEFRRLLRFVAGKSPNKKINIDIESTSNALYYWGDKRKKEILENYLLEKYNDKK